MRILVISDSHGRHSYIEKAIELHPDAKHVFFLGDVLSDIEHFDKFYPDRIFHKVSGNCDGFSDCPLKGSVTLAGKNIFFTHGHEFAVKRGNETLLSYAKACGADIVLYGHTHTANTEYVDGIYLVNPGSIGKDGCSFAVIDIVGKEAIAIIKHI